MNNRENPKFIVAVGGVMGSGKTHLAVGLGSHLQEKNIPHKVLDIDDVARKDKPVPLTGREAYAALKTSCLSLAEEGHSMVVSATFRDRPDRKMIQSVAETFGYVLIGLFLIPRAPVAIRQATHRVVHEEPNHLLKPDDIQAKIMDWKRRFHRGHHQDLKNNSWLVIKQVPPREELVQTAMGHVYRHIGQF